MKKLVLLLICALISMGVLAQHPDFEIQAKVTKNITSDTSKIATGSTISVTEVEYYIDSESLTPNIIYTFKTSDNQEFNLRSSRSSLPIDFIVNDIQDLWDKHIIESVIPSFAYSVGDDM